MLLGIAELAIGIPLAGGLVLYVVCFWDEGLFHDKRC